MISVTNNDDNGTILDDIQNDLMEAVNKLSVVYYVLTNDHFVDDLANIRNNNNNPLGAVVSVLPLYKEGYDSINKALERLPEVL